MRRLVFSAHLPDELFDELQAAARERKCSPAKLCAEAIEATLAAHRLPRVTTVESRPRVLVETTMRSLDEVEHRGVRPMDAAEITSVDELTCLGDIR